MLALIAGPSSAHSLKVEPPARPADMVDAGSPGIPRLVRFDGLTTLKPMAHESMGTNWEMEW